MANHDPDADPPPDLDSDEAFGEWLHACLKKKHGFESRALPARRKRGGKPVAVASAALWDRVRRVEERIQASTPPALRKQVEIVRMDEVNAFAVPGRYVYVTSELLRSLPTDDALALVVGHELAHGDLGHLLQFRRRAMWKDVPAGDIVFILLYLAQRFVASPENERDADAYGLDLALQAGYDGDKCLEALAILDAYMMKHEGAERLVVGPDAAHRLTADPFEEWKARAEVWLYEHSTGYPAVRERRAALAERLAQHRNTESAPLLLPGSRKSSAAVTAGLLGRIEAIDAELDQWGTEMTALGAELAGLMRAPTCRRLIAAIDGTAAGLDGRTAREVEPALAALHETARQTTVLLGMHERATEIRRFLSSDNPPQSALAELLALLFDAPAPRPSAGAFPRDTAYNAPEHDVASAGTAPPQPATAAGTSARSATDNAAGKTLPRTAARSVGTAPESAAQPPAGTTPRQLVQALRHTFEGARAIVHSVEDAWARWAPELAAYREDLDLLDQACRAIPLDRAAALNEIAAQIDALQRRVDADPLAQTIHAGDDLRAAVATARAEIRARVAERRAAG